MGEFKYIEGNAKIVQKLLNQWKHQFIINPLKIEFSNNFNTGDRIISMLLWREPINPNQEGE